MMGHKICFSGEIRLIIPKLSLLPLLIWSSAYTTGTINIGTTFYDKFFFFVKRKFVSALCAYYSE